MMAISNKFIEKVKTKKLLMSKYTTPISPPHRVVFFDTILRIAALTVFLKVGSYWP